MRYFLTPNSDCKAVCSHCAEASVDPDWGGWKELDPMAQVEGEVPICCDNCGASMEDP